MLTRRMFLGTAATAAAAAGAGSELQVKAKRKPPDPWVEYPTRTVGALAGFQPGPVPRNRYGGRTDRKQKATGFFRPVEIDGRWWLVDPEGGQFLNVAVVSVSAGKSKRNVAALKEKFGTESRWAEETTALLRTWHFNGVGNWSAVEPLRSAGNPLAYTVAASFMGTFGRKLNLVHQQPGHLGYVNDSIPVFHPGFESFCDEYARSIVTRRDDPYLLGYFSDNELPAPKDLIEKSLQLDGANERLAPGLKAARDWLARRKGASANVSDLTDEDRDAFLGHVYGRYLELTSRALRKHDSNHLRLGPRFHGGALKSPGIWRAAGKHLDVIAANVYWQWSPDEAMIGMWRKEAGRPFIVTEFYAKGDDVGFPNNSGAGWIVPTQKDRGLFYQNFALGLLESRLSVGWHWFKYMDNDPEDLTTDPSNRDSNKGIVTIDYRPYEALLKVMDPLNRDVYSLADWFDRRRG